MTTAVSVRLPGSTLSELDDLATLTDRPRTYLIRQAIDSYLADYADYQVALDRLHDKNDEIISGKELRERLGL